MKSDFSRSMAVVATSFNTRYVTHVRGLKYEIVMDSHFDTVTAMGVGHRLWHECYFSKEEIRDLRSDVKTIVEKILKLPNYEETVIRCQSSCPCQPVPSPRRVDIASVSGQDSPIILDTPHSPKYS